MGHGPSTVTSKGLAAVQKQASKHSIVLGALFWGHNRTHMLQKDGHNSIMKYRWKV
jgi:hypothetical protein